MLRVIGFMMNLRSRLTAVATGDQALFMTRAAFEAAGGMPLPLMEDVAISKTLRRLARPPACASASPPRRGAGRRAGVAHHVPHVAVVPGLFSRRLSGGTRAALPVIPTGC